MASRSGIRVAAAAVLGLISALVLAGCPPTPPASDENPFEGFSWAKRAGGAGSDRGYGLSALPTGSSAVTGYYSGAATFGPGEADEVSWSSAGQRDVFVALHNANGTLAFAVAAGGAGDDVGYDVSLLADGTFVVTGSYGSPLAVFGPQAADKLPLAGATDIFVARYNANGSLAYAKRAGGTQADEGLGVATLSDGTAFVTGYFMDQAGFGVGEANETSLIANGQDREADIFVARYAPNGLLEWAVRDGGTAVDIGYAIDVLAGGATVVTGLAHADPPIPSFVKADDDLFKALGRSVYVARVRSDGLFEWRQEAPGAGAGYGICALGDGTCLVVGAFYGQVIFGQGERNQTTLVSAGSRDMFIAKYAANGDLLWARRAGGASGDTVARSVRAYANGSFVVAGSFQSKATFGLGESRSATLVSRGEDDAFLAMYDANGRVQWATRMGGTLSDIGFGVAALDGGESLVAGRFRGTATFGIRSDNRTSLTSAGACDVFLARFPD